MYAIDSATLRTDTVTFLTALFAPEDSVLIRYLGNRDSGIKPATQHDTPENIIANIPDDFATKAAHRNYNVYFGVCPRVKPSEQFDLAFQIPLSRCLWQDLDNCQPSEALARCNKAGLPRPSIVVSSGYGVQLYWLLRQPYLIPDCFRKPVFTDWIDGKPKRWFSDESGKNYRLPSVSPAGQYLQNINAGIARLVAGDHTTDLARIFRLPGTWNVKREKPVACRIVEKGGIRYNLDEFDKFALGTVSTPAGKETAAIPLTETGEGELYPFLYDCANAPLGARSKADDSLIAFAIKQGFSPNDVWDKVKDTGKFAERTYDNYFLPRWRKLSGYIEQHEEAIAQIAAFEYPVVSTPNERKTMKPNRAYTIAEYLNQPPARYLVHKHLIEGAIGMLYGLSGAGKSFFAIDIMVSVATGKPLFGTYPTRQASVLYLLSESDGTFQPRLKAYSKHHNVNLANLDNVLILPEALDFQNKTAVVSALSPIGNYLKPGLVIIDTLNRNIFGDENSAKDMNGFTSTCELIRKMFGCAVLIIHHAGKEDARGARGHSSLFNACDTVIKVDGSPTTEVSTIYCEKVKCGKPFASYALVKTVVELDSSDPDNPDSVVLVRQGETVPEEEKMKEFVALWSDELERADTLKNIMNADKGTLRRIGWNAVQTCKDKVTLAQRLGLLAVHPEDENKKGIAFRYYRTTVDKVSLE